MADGAMGGDEKAAAGGGGSVDAAKEQRPPLPVQMRLPEDVMFFEAPQIARWNDERKCWVADAVRDLQYKEEQRIISCKLERFGIFTFIQDRHINMPFQSWELSPIDVGHVRLHIIAAIVEVEFEIINDKVMLVKPDERPELKGLLHKPMGVDEFIASLRHAGVNLFPDGDSFRYVGIQTKNNLVERRCYEQMALVSSGLAFAWSKWNADCNENTRIVMQATPWTLPEPPNEEEWKILSVERHRAAQLAMNEFAEAFSDERATGLEYCATLFHCARQSCGENSLAWSRVVDSPYSFVLTVERMLKATRLLIYT